MATLNTLNTIIDDILLSARNNNIAESETISRIQIEQWIVRYRSLLLKQDIDKGRSMNSDYIQDIDNVIVSYTNSSGASLSLGAMARCMTTVQIPSCIDFHFEEGLVSITDNNGDLIQLSSEKRALRQKNRRWTSSTPIAYSKFGYLYVVNKAGLTSINIRGIFENPMDPFTGLTPDEAYPIPANMLGPLKELIINKEILARAISDTINNSNDDTNQQTQRPVNETDRKKKEQ